MRKNIFAMLLSLTLLAGFSSSLMAAIEFEVGGGWHQMNPSGNLQNKGTTALDVKTNLGYDTINVFTGRVRAEFPIPFVPNVLASILPMKFEGNGMMTAPFQFGDKTFVANVPFSSTLQLDSYDLCLFYNIPFVKALSQGRVNASLGLNTRTFNFKSEINQPGGPGLESKSMTIPVPMAFVGLYIKPLSRLSLDAELKTMAYNSNSFIDATFRAKIKVFSVIFVSGGYKIQTIKIDQDGYKGDITFGGPTAELGISF